MTLMAARPVVVPHLEFGPECGDHVSLRVLPPRRSSAPDDSVWLVCPVHVHVGGFSGDVAAVLHLEELYRFGEALESVSLGVRRTAVLESSQGWIDLTVTRAPDGSIQVTGHVTDEPGSGSRLGFRLTGLHPDHVDTWIEACAAVDTVLTRG